MSHFPYVKLKSCCDVVGGSTPKRNVPEYWNGDIPWVTPKDISATENAFLNDSPEYISKKGYDSCSTYLLPKNSILLTSRAPIGNIAISGKEMCTNQGFKSLIPHKGVDFLYLYYCIKYHSPKLQALGNGATFKEVSKKVVEDFKIPLPSLEEQKRIAAILDKADAVRRKRQQAIELSEQLLRSVFLDMFGDPVLNPKGWNLIPLSELCQEKLQNGAYYPKDLYVDDNQPGTKMIHMSDAFYNLANIENAKRVRISDKDIDKYGLKPSDVLGARRSLNFEGAAKPCRIPLLSEPVIYESSLIRIRPNLNIILPEYLFYFLSDPGARKKYLSKYITSSTISGINQGNLAKVEILVPEISEQRKFVNILHKCESHIKSLNHNKSYLDNLFSSLTQKAFKGGLSKHQTTELV